jgi:hypothetical protein
MMRTVWLATTCLAVLVALGVAKALTTSVTPIVERQPDETTMATAQDTLTKADRLELIYVRQEIPAQPALHPTEPFIPPVPTIVPPVEKIISRHWHDPNDTTSSAAKSKQPKKMVATKKANQAVDRSKLVER